MTDAEFLDDCANFDLHMVKEEGPAFVGHTLKGDLPLAYQDGVYTLLSVEGEILAQGGFEEVHSVLVSLYDIRHMSMEAR